MTAGYAWQAPDLLRRYESITFADAHRAILHLIPRQPSDVVDIGAGTGRDAAAFAGMGHRVVAVEPTAEMRLGAMRLHPSPRIEWLDDSLPDLTLLTARRETYDLVMLTAVWMHLDKKQRRRAMTKVSSLVRTGGMMSLTLRHGPVPAGRRMFAVSAEETVGLAAARGLRVALELEAQPSLGQVGVTWTRLVFKREG
ncbi:MAG: class I SAM-dependent methyltransferase [Stellaceae bacterium]